MLDHPAAASNARDRRRLWPGRAAHLGLGILCALLGQAMAAWITGTGPAERLVTLPAALGLLVWLLAQVLREVVVLLRWPPPRRATGGMGGAELLCSLLGFGAMLLSRHWLGWGLLGLAGAGLARAGLARAGLGLRRRIAAVSPE